MPRGAPFVFLLTALLLPQVPGGASPHPDSCQPLLQGRGQVGVDRDVPVVFAEGSDFSARLRDLFREVHGKALGSVTLKNLLVHSARDLGPKGPDPCYGHGLADLDLATRIVRAAALEDTRSDLTRHSPAGAVSNGVEQVRVPIPEVGRWNAIVEGYSVAVGPQPFSLILSVSRGNEIMSPHEPG